MQTLNSIVPDSVVEKIRKLLALASELNDSKEQAEMALAKAKSLAVAHQVDLAAIQVFENKPSEEPIEKGDEINLGKRASVAQSFINQILRNHFNVKLIYTGGRYSGRSLIFIGKKSDIEIATYVCNFLNGEFMRLWHKYRKTYQSSQAKDRNSYFWGLKEGLETKLTEGKKETEATAFETLSKSHSAEQVEQVKNCFALATTTNEERIEEATAKFFPRLRTTYARTRYSHSGEARTAGFGAGKNISLSRGISAGGGGQID